MQKEVKRGYLKWRDENGKLHKEPYNGQVQEVLNLEQESDYDGEEEE